MRGKGFSTDNTTTALEGIYGKYRDQKGTVIPILQDIQKEFGYLPEEAVNWMADRMDIPRSNFFGVATFYAQFHFKPRGEKIITVCCGTACHVRGSERLLTNVRRELNLPEDEDTTKDMRFTVEKVACLGTCSMAPAVIIDKRIHGQVTPSKLRKQIKALTRK